MRFVYFVITILNYLIFAYDIENDRDFMTWIWLATAIYFAINTHLAYKKFKAESVDKKSECEVLNIPDVTNWVAVADKMPPRPDDDYLVAVRNKNKEYGIAIIDIQQYTSDGRFVGGSSGVGERVVCWAELPEPPYL